MNVVFEGDSSLVMAAMNGQDDDCSPLGPIINDLHFLLKTLPRQVLNHVQRESNSARHSLDRVGIDSYQQFVWFEEPPGLLRDILCEDAL